MAALDNTAIFGLPPASRLRLRLSLVGGIALSTTALVVSAIVLRGVSENGWRLGSQLAWRFTALVFFAALVAGPIMRVTARIFPVITVPEGLGRKLVWGFCASYAVYLLSVFVPNVVRLSAGATLMVLLGGIVTLALAVTAAPLGMLSERIRRTLMGTAVLYFWLCYSLMALSRIYGPHRPDAFYGASLSLMLVALLVRYADRWFARAPQVSPAV